MRPLSSSSEGFGGIGPLGITARARLVLFAGRRAATRIRTRSIAVPVSTLESPSAGLAGDPPELAALAQVGFDEDHVVAHFGHRRRQAAGDRRLAVTLLGADHEDRLQLFVDREVAQVGAQDPEGLALLGLRPETLGAAVGEAAAARNAADQRQFVEVLHLLARADPAVDPLEQRREAEAEQGPEQDAEQDVALGLRGGRLEGAGLWTSSAPPVCSAWSSLSCSSCFRGFDLGPGLASARARRGFLPRVDRVLDLGAVRSAELM